MNLTNPKKVEIGKHSISKPEIDIVGYKALCKELFIIEVKSFLDSPSIKYDELNQDFEIPDSRFKLFTSKNYRAIVHPNHIGRFAKPVLFSNEHVTSPDCMYCYEPQISYWFLNLWYLVPFL